MNIESALWHERYPALIGTVVGIYVHGWWTTRPPALLLSYSSSSLNCQRDTQSFYRCVRRFYSMLDLSTMQPLTGGE